MIDLSAIKEGDDVIEVAISCVDDSSLTLITSEGWAYKWLQRESHEGMALSAVHVSVKNGIIHFKSYVTDEEAWQFVKEWSEAR